MRRTATVVAATAVLGAALVIPASPASACSAPRTPERPSGYCEMPRPIDESPSPAPSPSECVLRIVTYAPAYPAWGMDGSVKQGVDVFTNPGHVVTLTGYERPGTDVRTLGAKGSNRDGYVNFPVTLQGSARVFATSDSPVCDGRTETAVAAVQARFGNLTAQRNSPRNYSFAAFYAGPAGKVGNLYRVLPDGREVLTSQTRLRGEFALINRVFLGSGRFGFVLRTGDDINSLGGSTNIRDTVIH